MAKSSPEPGPHRARTRLQQIRQSLSQIDYIVSGTLLRRRKRCGKPGCACATDPAAQHGPYYEWSRLERGRLVHTVLPRSLGPVFARAAKNYHQVRRLLRRWERESVKALTAETEQEP